MDPGLSSAPSAEASTDRSRGAGVIFARRDCAGLIRRLLVDVVDVLVLAGVAGLIVAAAEYVVGASPEAITAVGWLTILLGGWAYLAVLKASRWRTLGFRLFDVRIVTLRGERPSIFRMTCRLLLWGFGPFNQLVDWLWLGGDPARQTLRDKVAGTLVVRSQSVPVAHGSVHAAFYDLFSFNIPFFEVRRAEAAADSIGCGATPAASGPGREGSDPALSSRTGTAVTVTWCLCALVGIAWVASGRWTEFLDQSPRSFSVNNADRVLYDGTATRAEASELAEFLTELGYFGQMFPSYAYLDGGAGGIEVSFFVSAEAWNDSATWEYHQALSALIERRFPRSTVVLRTPDWSRARYVRTDPWESEPP